MRAMEIWGGVECTINRVGTTYMDQLQRTGHDRRSDDIERIAELGVKRVRYPVLWERTVAFGAGEHFSWAHARLGRLRDFGIVPIVGLLHHGSGPPRTSLLDPEFPTQLAAYAASVARQFPWISDYTPVNEPLTTARFSCLYGHWYPHLRDPRAFATALLNQCHAIALSMRAIRRINPGARLVQTDDLGHVRATPRLLYQAEFENERRWLAFDLLMGRVDEQHPMWPFLRDASNGERLLGLLRDEPCVPHIVGLNYYVTSERFLDDRLALYPGRAAGGNARDRYVDVEAARVCPEGLLGARRLLGQAWQRLGRPLALTEAHLGCSVEEQVRWLHSIDTAAHGARLDGADVLAWTAWALFGSYDWHTLLTRRDDLYEPGVFDCRAEPPVATLVAQYVRARAEGRRFEHPVLKQRGWWECDARLLENFARRPTVPVAQSGASSL
jgi:dTDP-4-dehydrorhamnose reductase